MNVIDHDNVTDDYNNNCIDNETNFDIFISSILFSIPCGLSFLCLMSLMVYTLIKPFSNDKGI